MDFVEQSYWDNSYSKIEIDSFPENDSIIRFIRENLPDTDEHKSMCEIGCFPGRYMSIFGEKGYNINGIDLTPRTKELEDALKLKGYSVGNIEHGDFFLARIGKFDVVCSFGFVEHFEEFSNVIERHLEHVNDGGYVLIAAPNFRGFFQYLYHKIFDNINLKRHNIKSMRPFQWEKLIQKRGFKIISCGFIGNEIWRDTSTRHNILLRIIEKILIKLLKITSLIKPNNSLSSGYCIVLAKKNDC